MSKRKRDKARLQRQLQGVDMNILLGQPRNLLRTPEGSTSQFNGDPERIRSTWRPLQYGITASGSTGTLYGPPGGYKEVTVVGEEDMHTLLIEVVHANGRLSSTYEAASYSACARKAWQDLRELELTKEHQTHVERGKYRTIWCLETEDELKSADLS